MTSAFAEHIDMTVAGGPVRLYRSGDDGPPVLLLHGGALDTAEGVWRSVAPTLAREYRVYAVDLPRHGESRPWRGDLNSAFFETLIGDLLDQLNLSRVAIIGLSLGGGLGIGYALQHPDRVSALIAIGPGGIGAKRKAHFVTWLVARAPGLMRLSATYLAHNPKRLRKSMSDSLTAGVATPGFDAIVASALAEARAKSRHRERVLDDWMINAVGPFRMPSITYPSCRACASRACGCAGIAIHWLRMQNCPPPPRPHPAALWRPSGTPGTSSPTTSPTR